MKQATAVLALAAGAQALVPRADTCCFGLTAKSASSLGGKVGQLSDGQNRINQTGLPDGSYCIDSNGGLTDGKGRGCILTPPTTQWQCDAGAKPTNGFSVQCDGQLSYGGSTSFWSCPTSDNGGYNIYTQKLMGQDGCQQVWLWADGCKSACPSPSPPPSSSSSTKPTATPTPTPSTSSKPTMTPTPTPSPSSSSSSSVSKITWTAPPPPTKTCPMDLKGWFEYPHLILPVDSAQPDVAFATSFNGTASGSESSIFNFDVPQSAAGKTCNLVFPFPKQSQLETSAYTFSGNGGVSFAYLSGPAQQGKTTYNTMPKAKQDLGVWTMAPGNAYTIATMACPAGQAVAFSMTPKGDTCLNYFQDYNPCPIGLYMTVA